MGFHPAFPLSRGSSVQCLSFLLISFFVIFFNVACLLIHLVIVSFDELRILVNFGNNFNFFFLFLIAQELDLIVHRCKVNLRFSL